MARGAQELRPVQQHAESSRRPGNFIACLSMCRRGALTARWLRATSRLARLAALAARKHCSFGLITAASKLQGHSVLLGCSTFLVAAGRRFFMLPLGCSPARAPASFLCSRAFGEFMRRMRLGNSSATQLPWQLERESSAMEAHRLPGPNLACVCRSGLTAMNGLAICSRAKTRTRAPIQTRMSPWGAMIRPPDGRPASARFSRPTRNN